MPLNAAGINAAANAVAGIATYASLHTGDPGSIGSGEVSGGAPAYARKPITWPPASSGVSVSSAPITFDVPAGVTVYYVGFWSALTGGSFVGGTRLVDVDGNSASAAFSTQGTYQLTQATLSAVANIG